MMKEPPRLSEIIRKMSDKPGHPDPYEMLEYVLMERFAEQIRDAELLDTLRKKDPRSRYYRLLGEKDLCSRYDAFLEKQYSRIACVLCREKNLPEELSEEEQLGNTVPWEDGFSISVRVEKDTAVLKADRAGMNSLAGICRMLGEKTAGHHIHLDQYNALEEGSAQLIIEYDPDFHVQ